MALNPTKEDKLEDISFINKKRTPKMKSADEVKSPFSSINNDYGNPIAQKSEDRQHDPNSKLDSPKQRAEHKAPTLKGSKADRNYRNIELTKDAFQSMIKRLGPEKASYAILLKMASCENNLISISYKESCVLFGLKSEKSAKLILNNLEKEGIIKMKNKANPSEGKPTTYHIEF